MIAKLDSHLHVWTLARGDYTWLQGFQRRRCLA